MKKTIFLICGLILLIALAFYKCDTEFRRLTDSVMNDLGSNTIIETVYSPDGRWKAVVFQHNGGATTRYSFNVSVLEKEEKLENKDTGNIYIGYSEVSLKWKDNKKIIIDIQNSKEQIFKQKTKYKEWGITYLLR